MIVLPTVKSNPKSKNPKFLIYFGKPKSGKTTIASMLDNNLIIDLENGSEFLSALSIQARTVNDLAEIAEAIKAKNKEINGYAYKYITIDNGTKLEDVALSYAAKLYKSTPMGKNWDGTDVRELPNGSGYYYLKKAFQKIIDIFKPLAPTFILICHCSDKLINKEGKELSEMSLDLTGKIARYTAADADAIGYVYRNKNQTIMNFNGGGDCIVEARADHLRGKEIVIAESDENGVITSHWDKIFLTD